jgi:hypothetical protein
MSAELKEFAVTCPACDFYQRTTPGASHFKMLLRDSGFTVASPYSGITTRDLWVVAVLVCAKCEATMTFTLGIPPGSRWGEIVRPTVTSAPAR